MKGLGSFPAVDRSRQSRNESTGRPLALEVRRAGRAARRALEGLLAGSDHTDRRRERGGLRVSHGPPPFVSSSNLLRGIKGSDGPVSAHSPGITPAISAELRDNGP